MIVRVKDEKIPLSCSVPSLSHVHAAGAGGGKTERWSREDEEPGGRSSQHEEEEQVTAGGKAGKDPWVAACSIFS